VATRSAYNASIDTVPALQGHQAEAGGIAERPLWPNAAPSALEAVHFDVRLLGKFLRYKELRNCHALVTLDLDNLAKLLVCGDTAVAGQILWGWEHIEHVRFRAAV
jgi:hypothetical protein